jgi:hypothetical protein
MVHRFAVAMIVKIITYTKSRFDDVALNVRS